uniref:non-specific serine/threonine protein kinase n=1 Tax=Caenorhabditis tropicalis TaxID=1561998 RepID=A0A1I7UPL1_9PELO
MLSFKKFLVFDNPYGSSTSPPGPLGVEITWKKGFKKPVTPAKNPRFTVNLRPNSSEKLILHSFLPGDWSYPQGALVFVMPVAESLRCLAGTTALDCYQLRELLAFGSFGAVYRGYAATCEVAVKISEEEKMSENESEILLILQGLPRVPQWLYYGAELGRQYLVMTMAYRDLDQMRLLNKSSGYRFNNENLQKILYQSVKVLKTIHLRNVIHRDIKANNLMISHPMGPLHAVNIMIVDYGLAAEYKDENDQYIDLEDNPRLRRVVHSTPNVQLGMDHSCYDDLLQLSYAAIAMYNDHLHVFRLPDRQRLNHKQSLLRDPASVLQSHAQWLVPFFEALREQDELVLDYEEVLDGIQKSLPGSDANGELRLVDVSGTLRLL